MNTDTSFFRDFDSTINILDFHEGLDSKESACNSRDLSLIAGLGRSPGEGNDNPPQ